MANPIWNLRIWFFGWMDTCSAAGMSEAEAKAWIAKRWEYVKQRIAFERTRNG
jgi:hypothetical protein